MNSDSNTEIDLLLRRHGRRKATLASAANERAAGGRPEETGLGPHMDADEMNAYAEGELPGPARERALVHLADCDQCRAIVTELKLAANVPLEAEDEGAPQLQPSRASWRTWLAALFAPPVMRYATAAIVLLCVVGAAFLVMRQQKRESRQEEPQLVARNNESPGGEGGSAVKPGLVEPQQSANQASSPAPLASPAGTNGEPAPLKDSKAGPTTAESGQAPADANRTAQMNDAQPKEAAKTDAPAAVAGAAPAPVSRSESTSEVTARDQADEDRSLARRNAPASPAPPAATTAVAGARPPQTPEADKTKQSRKDDSPSRYRVGETSSVNNSASDAARESEETVPVSKPAPSASARRRATRPEAKAEGTDSIGRSSGALRSERATETRSVGGRQFRRQGSAWVDTAYTSGRATVNVRRGSEQYRALVADEPGLRSIAEQLGGEVIVVWSGRAYRIN
jgi:Putative zinc-finger